MVYSDAQASSMTKSLIGQFENSRGCRTMPASHPYWRPLTRHQREPSHERRAPEVVAGGRAGPHWRNDGHLLSSHIFTRCWRLMWLQLLHSCLRVISAELSPRSTRCQCPAQVVTGSTRVGLVPASCNVCHRLLPGHHSLQSQDPMQLGNPPTFQLQDRMQGCLTPHRQSDPGITG
jgi:hypothetical protein